MLQKTLKIVPPPLAIAAVASAPPVLEEAGPTVEYACGHCGDALMRVWSCPRLTGHRAIVIELA